MNLLLRRISSRDRCTLGVLSIGDVEVFTIERPWLNNEPRVSCVPVGLYELEPHSSADHPGTWALVGGTVAHYPTPGRTRFAILFHAANLASELMGCIAPGMGAQIDKAQGWRVTSSRDALSILLSELDSAGLHTLRISQL